MTLTPSDDARRLNSPPLQGRGRGWGLSADRLALLQKRAAEMRRNPTAPEQRLWSILSGSRLAGYKFRRQAVIGGFIADFLCPQKALIIEVDGDTHDATKDRLRDDRLAALGYRVVRFSNYEVMSNIDGVAHSIAMALSEMPDRWARPHPNPASGRSGPRPDLNRAGRGSPDAPEGEGLSRGDRP